MVGAWRCIATGTFIDNWQPHRNTFGNLQGATIVNPPAHRTVRFRQSVERTACRIFSQSIGLEDSAVDPLALNVNTRLHWLYDQRTQIKVLSLGNIHRLL